MSKINSVKTCENTSTSLLEFFRHSLKWYGLPSIAQRAAEGKLSRRSINGDGREIFESKWGILPGNTLQQLSLFKI